MTILLLAIALDCMTLPLIARWKGEGDPVYYERLIETTADKHVQDNGCRIEYAGIFHPELISWCNFLGPERCTLRVEGE